MVPAAHSSRPIDPGVTIGHVHLRTADIDRVRGFYVDVLGFDVILEARDVPGWGTTGDMLFCRRAATTTTSASTRGSRPAAACKRGLISRLGAARRRRAHRLGGSRLGGGVRRCRTACP